MAALAAVPSSSSRGAPSNLQVNLLQGLAISELDFKDNRYPSLSSTHRPVGTMLFGSSDSTQPWDATSGSLDSVQKNIREALAWSMDESQTPGQPCAQQKLRHEHLQEQQLDHQDQQQLAKSALSYILPPGSSRRVVERYALDDPVEGADLSMNPANGSPQMPVQESSASTQQPPTQPPSRDIPHALIPANPRHPSLPPGAAGPSNTSKYSPNNFAGSPSYDPTMGIPISPNFRAYPQHPTYIDVTPSSAPDPVKPSYAPMVTNPPEEVCVECAMRDQDMADVDVTSPGVWERESDVLYQELLLREEEGEKYGINSPDSSIRSRGTGGELTEQNLKIWSKLISQSGGHTLPRATGNKLTEQNLKVWLTMNPREPQARQQTLDQYIKVQKSLLQAEALAHARAMQESMHLESLARDAYSHLRRSAYEFGSSSILAEETSGSLRLKTRSASSPTRGFASHLRGHSRELTFLENGLIVEQIDVRREEKEEKEWRRKQERRERSRARKSSRGSAVDVLSLYSTQSLTPNTDSGVGLAPNSRLSGLSRPGSSLAAPVDRLSHLTQGYSQASLSDVHGGNSPSPRRSRFFGFRNLSTGWRSQESLAQSRISGSMIDMHVALQKEANAQRIRSPADNTLSSRRQSQLWLSEEPTEEPQADAEKAADKPKKKKTGFAKIWKLVTNKSSPKEDRAVNDRGTVPSVDRQTDDLPLTPPPPLSYLVDRGGASEHHVAGRHGSTPSLHSTSSPRNAFSSPGMSPPTAPSSLLPSPTSSRPSAGEETLGDSRKPNVYQDEREHNEVSDPKSAAASTKNVHSVTSEPDMRQRRQDATGAQGESSSRPAGAAPAVEPRSLSIWSREKSLPPLPDESRLRPQVLAAEPRPQTVYTFDARHPSSPSVSNDLEPLHAPFRTAEVRRQSFGGLTSRPTFGVHLSLRGADPATRASSGVPYTEFGFSRRSLGRLEHIQENPPAPETPTKRRSKFALSSLLGRRRGHAPDDVASMSNMSPQEFPKMSLSGSDGRDEHAGSGGGNAHGSSYFVGSRHSTGPRLSVTSRKALEELVEQDREFVAYRYPSTDQRLDIIR